MSYIPDRGDLVWLNFSPQAGREQAGNRPAVVLSALDYNRRVGLALFCPITSQEKGYPFEVKLPPGLRTNGVVLADQVKSLDWRTRDIRYIEKLPSSTLADVVFSITAFLLPRSI